jgi:hypothetical protein
MFDLVCSNTLRVGNTDSRFQGALISLRIHLTDALRARRPAIVVPLIKCIGCFAAVAHSRPPRLGPGNAPDLTIDSPLIRSTWIGWASYLCSAA